MSAVSTRRLTKRFRDLTAVDALDLEIQAGTLFGFLGPNGSGKSTTIRMMLGLVRPTAGEVDLLGEPIGPSVLRRVGAIIEEPRFWPYLSGRRNLETYARASGPPDDRRLRLERVDEVLELVELAHDADRKVKAYSQGMRQRLGIARALLGAPDLLVLDEPTNGLDPQGMRDVRLLLRRLADAGTTVFVSSHLLAEVEAMCDTVGVLSAGRLVAQGSPASLRPAAQRLRIDVNDTTEAVRVVDRMRLKDVEAGGDGRLTVSLTDEVTAAQLNKALVDAGVEVHALVPEHEGLEDAFLSLTGTGTVTDQADHS